MLLSSVRYSLWAASIVAEDGEGGEGDLKFNEFDVLGSCNPPTFRYAQPSSSGMSMSCLCLARPSHVLLKHTLVP